MGTVSDSKDGGRDGRRRDPKATSLLFNTALTPEDVQSVEIDAKEKAEWVHVEANEVQDDDKMDVDGDEEVEVHPIVAPAQCDEVKQHIWGMPRWGWEDERKEVRRGVRLVGMEEVSF